MSQSLTDTTLAPTFEPDLQDIADYSVNRMRIRMRLAQANSIEDYSHILGDHLSFGNSKISKNTAIFNLNSAHGCPNRETQEEGESDTGLCQVSFSECYAAKAEKMYKQSLPYRQRQAVIWNSLDPDTFAQAFKRVVDRKRNSVDSLRLSEAGDFRTNQDIYKAERIAELLEDIGVDTYTYSASYKLTGWSDTDALTVMESVTGANYGDASYDAFATVEDIPENYTHCPHDYQKQQGVEDPVSCGDCRLCVDGNVDVAITLH